MTEPSEEAMRVWEEAYAACMLGGLDERAAAAVIEAALAKAEVKGAIKALDKAIERAYRYGDGCLPLDELFDLKKQCNA